jgi:hypothetical protein
MLYYLVAFVLVAFFAKHVLDKGWFPQKASAWVQARLTGHAKLTALALSAVKHLTDAIRAAYYLSLLEIVLTVVLIAFPPMLVVVKSYRNQLLDFVSILITASSVLLGFAFAAEIGRQPPASSSRSKPAKALGGVCVFLCVLALIFNAFSISGVIGQDIADGTLSLAILAFLAQAFVMSGFL